MKKLLFACIAAATFCALGPAAEAYPSYRHAYYYGHGYPGHRFAYFGPYGYYPYPGPRRVFIDSFFYAPPPVYYCPPPRPTYYRERVAPERDYKSTPRNDDYSK